MSTLNPAHGHSVLKRDQLSSHEKTRRKNPQRVVTKQQKRAREGYILYTPRSVTFWERQN